MAFERIHPATEAEASALVGACVDYRGDMANAGGVGAIVGTGRAFCGVGVDVVLDDGRRFPGILPHSLARPGPGDRFSLTGERRGADYLAQLLAAEATRRATQSAAAELRAAAFRAEVQALKLANPHLETESPNPARNMRAALRAAFPGVKFSVRSDHSSIRVRWTDGPTPARVEAIADRFQRGHFDGMTDCYQYSRSPWCEAFGGVEHVFCNRDESDALMARAIAAAHEQFGDRDAPTLEDYRAGRAWRMHPGDSFAGSDHWSWQSIIYRAARELEG